MVTVEIKLENYTDFYFIVRSQSKVREECDMKGWMFQKTVVIGLEGVKTGDGQSNTQDIYNNLGDFEVMT